MNQRKDKRDDLNGNLLKTGFVYDEFDQLVQAERDCYVYDALGRRLKLRNFSYFYFEGEEVGSFVHGKIKDLKILGSSAPIAIELDGDYYFATVDVQNTIRQLIDSQSGRIILQNNSDAFGKGVNFRLLYAYAGKRYDIFTKCDFLHTKNF